MTTDQLTSPALRSLLPQFIAEAIARADLPPLTQPEDREFLWHVLEFVVDAFWQAYVGQLSLAARRELQEAGQDETGETLVQWIDRNGPIEGNIGGQLLAQEIMKDLQEKLPPILREAYEDLHSTRST